MTISMMVMMVNIRALHWIRDRLTLQKSLQSQRKATNDPLFILPTGGDGLQVPAWTGAFVPDCWLCACDVFAKPTTSPIYWVRLPRCHRDNDHSGQYTLQSLEPKYGTVYLSTYDSSLGHCVHSDILFVSETWAPMRFFKVALYKFSHYYYYYY